MGLVVIIDRYRLEPSVLRRLIVIVLALSVELRFWRSRMVVERAGHGSTRRHGRLALEVFPPAAALRILGADIVPPFALDLEFARLRIRAGRRLKLLWINVRTDLLRVDAARPLDLPPRQPLLTDALEFLTVESLDVALFRLLLAGDRLRPRMVV